MSDDEMPEDAYVINWSDFECVEPIGMAASPRLGGREFKAAWFGTEVAIKEVSGIKQEDVRLAALQDFEILRYLPSLHPLSSAPISTHLLVSSIISSSLLDQRAETSQLDPFRTPHLACFSSIT
jgi:hypothetical protein